MKFKQNENNVDGECPKCNGYAEHKYHIDANDGSVYYFYMCEDCFTCIYTDSENNIVEIK